MQLKPGDPLHKLVFGFEPDGTMYRHFYLNDSWVVRVDDEKAYADFEGFDIPLSEIDVVRTTPCDGGLEIVATSEESAKRIFTRWVHCAWEYLAHGVFSEGLIPKRVEMTCADCDHWPKDAIPDPYKGLCLCKQTGVMVDAGFTTCDYFERSI